MAHSYRPAKGAQYNAEQAQVLGQTLERLGDAVTPRELVDAARPKNSPIHNLFEWNESRAAEAYRRTQARQHISHLEVIITTPQGLMPIKALHSVIISTPTEKPHRAYSHMANIVDNPELSNQVMESALAELRGWQARFALYRKVFSGVFQAIEQVKIPKPRAAVKKKKPTKRRSLAGAR